MSGNVRKIRRAPRLIRNISHAKAVSGIAHLCHCTIRQRAKEIRALDDVEPPPEEVQLLMTPQFPCTWGRRMSRWSPRRRRQTPWQRLINHRPTLEPLEERALLATMLWNTASGNYDVAANWTNTNDPTDHHVPTASDDAQINTAGITVTHSAGTDSVNSISDTGNITLSGGTLNVATTMSGSGSFTLSGGTLQHADVLAGTSITGTTSGGGLDGVILDGNASISGQNSVVGVSNGLVLNGTITVNNRGRIEFCGTQTLSGSGSILLNGTDNHTVLRQTVAGTTLTIASGITIAGSGGTIGTESFYGGPTNVTYLNQGTVGSNASGGVGITINPGTWTNDTSGTLEAISGSSTTLTSNLTNYENGTLTGGIYKVGANSALRIINSGIVTNAATIVLDGANSNFYRDTGSTSALADFVTNNGSFTVTDLRVFAAAASFNNTANLIVGTGGSFSETGTYIQSSATGVTQVDGILTTTNSTVNITGGIVQGNGTVAATLTNSATVNPCNAGPGILTISGSYIQTSAGTLDLELGGINAGNPDFDQIFIAGTATLAGTLNVTLINGFVPVAGNSFRVLTFTSRSGDFTTKNGLELGGGLYLATSYDQAGLTLITSHASINVNPTSGLVTTETGGTATFTIVLGSAPCDNVTIPVHSSDTTEGTVSPASVTFAPSNWSVPQTVTVTGQDRHIAGGQAAYTVITDPATSNDIHYNGIDPSDVSVTNLHDDTAGVTVNPTSGLITSESGQSATFTVVLNTIPSASVTIGLSSSDTNEGTVARNGARIHFGQLERPPNGHGYRS